MERKHKHLFETSRVLLFQSRVLVRFWGECLLCAAHLINTMPLSSVHFSSPYELLHGSKPSLYHLKFFGCLCYVSTVKAHRSKLDPRSIPCIFLWYPSAQKAYKVYDLENHKFIISKDIIFHEKHLPFRHFSISSHSYIPPIFLPANTPFDMDTYLDIPDSLIFPTSIPTTPNTIPTSSHITHTSSIPSSAFNLPSTPPPRLSTRPRKAPKDLDSYICTAQSITSHWCNIIFYDN